MPDFHMGCNAFAKIVGKTIVGVVYKRNKEGSLGRPVTQIFLVFSDNTYYEIYADSEMFLTKGIDQGGLEAVRKYMDTGMKTILEAVLNDKGEVERTV